MDNLTINISEVSDALTVSVSEPVDNITISIISSAVPGPAGSSYQESFETVSKNLKDYDFAINSNAGVIESIVYTTDASTITKTFNYTGGLLQSIVLSGDTPSGIDLTKTFIYDGSSVIGASYS